MDPRVGMTAVCSVVQCDQMDRLFVNLGYLQHWKFAQWYKILTKAGSIFAQH